MPNDLRGARIEMSYNCITMITFQKHMLTIENMRGRIIQSKDTEFEVLET